MASNALTQTALPTRPEARLTMKPSLFIRPIHPKTEIRPTAAAIQKILAAGWIGQLKMNGHRAQIHISADPTQDILVYNRQGQIHKKILPPLLTTELRRLFQPTQHWTVIDGEWVKEDDHIYVFDCLKSAGELLNRLSYLERWRFLPRAYISPAIQTLGILISVDQCLAALGQSEKTIEGLVFKSASPGFSDSSIIRCRRRP